ncbi:MAG: T9SS type A sorting domain-containing protein [Bacteroidales bacterium]|jgi:hypothetical protein|nr:T9SS type A sorting domain-containing protein [Bacteroidales bacterium]
MKNFLCILFFCACTWACVCICTSAFAQNIESIYYTYDNAGNRIGRTIVEEVPPSHAPHNNAPANDNDGEEDEYIPADALTDSDTPTPPQDYEAKIYPNPTADILNIKVSELSTLRYVLHGSTGTQLLSGSFTGETTLQIIGYARGIYYLSIYNDAKSPADRRVWKIIKQ